MNTNKMPGFTAELSLDKRDNSELYYTSTQDFDSTNLIVPMALVVGSPEGLGGLLGLKPISRCGAACKCCSRDGNAHCCDVCGSCE